MADNLSVAFQIYDKINQKQKEGVKNKTSKDEDIIDFSEHDFIEDLQKTVNYYTKNIEKATVIDDVYKNILKSVEGILNIDEITTSSGIRIPEKIILRSVDSAIKTEKAKNGMDENLNKTEQIILAALAMKEAMTNYDNLSNEEKKQFNRELNNKVWGETLGEQVTLVSDIYEIMDTSPEYIKASEDAREKLNKKIEEKDPIKVFAEYIGIDYNLVKSGRNRTLLTQIIDSIQMNTRDGNSFEHKIKMLAISYASELKELGIDSEIFEQKLKEDPQIIDSIKKSFKERDENKRLFETHEEMIRKKLSSIITSESLNKIPSDSLFNIMSFAFDKEGNIDSLSMQCALRAWFTSKKGQIFVEESGIVVDSIVEVLPSVIQEINDVLHPKEEAITDLSDELFGNLDMGFSEEYATVTEEMSEELLGGLDMGLSEEYTAISDSLIAGYMEAYSEDLILSPEMIQMLETGVGMNEDNVDYVEATDLQIPEAEVTPIYVASMDEIQVDPAIYGMSDEEKETPPEVEESEVGEKTSNSEEMQSVDLIAEEIDVKEDEETREEQEKDEDEDEDKTMPKVFGIDSFNALLNTIELTESENRSTYREILLNDKEIDNGNISK